VSIDKLRGRVAVARGLFRVGQCSWEPLCGRDADRRGHLPSASTGAVGLPGLCRGSSVVGQPAALPAPCPKEGLNDYPYRSAGPARWAQWRPWKTTSAELDSFLAQPEIQELIGDWRQDQELRQQIDELARREQEHQS
jgi:hypothetical protein